jgi:formamidopyrimidine-DNA glycosylase
MPELPDVECLRRYVDATSLHQTIDDMAVDAPRMLKETSAENLRATLQGKAFRGTARHGKHLLIDVADGPWLMLHFGMTGRLDYARQDGAPPEHTRLQIRFENGYRLAGIWQRRLGEITIAADPASFAEARELGPDALDLELDAFKALFEKRRGTIKSALMDQRFIAGLGNVYTDEILFHARIDPRRRAGHLANAELGELHRALLHVLRLAIERQADPDELPDSWLLPHRSTEARCPRCGARIEKVETAGRTGYRCPKCQG